MPSRSQGRGWALGMPEARSDLRGNAIAMSSAPAALRSNSSPLDAAGSFSISDRPVCAVVQLRHQQPGVVHQVVLDPAKVKGELIRLGEWPGDEASGWKYVRDVIVVEPLGYAARDGNTVTVTPILRDAIADPRESDHAID